MKNLFLLLAVIFIQIPLLAQEVEVMTYNIKYANETDGENSWSKRKDWITNQIKFYEPNIFGVQEALKIQLDYFEKNLKTYDYVGVGRDDGKTEGEYCALFYDTKKFEVLKSDTFWLSETPNQISVGWDAAMERICTYALFRDKKSEQEFWVFNAHLDHLGKLARKKSVALIWDKIEVIAGTDFPVILMGDFNLEPDSEGIKFLSKKMNDSKSKSEELVFGPIGTFNGYNFDEAVTRRIDYIFVNSKLGVKKYAVLSDSKDLKYPSDHLPVLVELKFE